MAFAGARRMHSGGLAGNEVPAILQRGEEVLTADDPRHRGNAGGKGGGGGPVTVTNNFNFPPGTDVETFRKSRTAIAAEMARAGEFAFGRNG